MTPQRIRELELDMDARLNPDEIAAGWHFCPDWDGMLVNLNDTEGEACFCRRLNDRLKAVMGEDK